ncbi:MAG: pseudaminic acid synthase [Ignavibacteriae bacterium]|nr:pseudaminic acid synthase [Ignavibacteriota bacterium]
MVFFDNNGIFIIAELSANHNHNLKTALKTIEAVKECGANAIKFQTYTPDTMTIDSDKDYFKIRGTELWDGKTLYNLYKEAYTPWEWHKELFEKARSLGLVCFSTPFDRSAVDFLEEIGNPIYKVASFEIQDIPLIEYMATKGKPMIISTGIAELEDIELAINACRNSGNNQIALLKCTSAYPAPVDEANLKTIPDMAKRFGVITGLSDHSLGISLPIAAVSLGAKIVEKHFILDKNIGGPDAAFSLEPKEFKEMVKSIREVEKALGKVEYEITEKAKKGKVFGRSLFVVKDIKAGDVFTETNIRSIRPGYGLHPKYYNEIIGKIASKDVERGEPLNWEMVSKRGDKETE